MKHDRPARIPRWPLRQHHIPRSSRRRPPEAPGGTRQSPQRQGRKALLTLGIPAYPRSTGKRHDRPVTPEVAGSSPVAPVENPCKAPFSVARSGAFDRWLSDRARDHPARESGCGPVGVKPAHRHVLWLDAEPESSSSRSDSASAAATFIASTEFGSLWDGVRRTARATPAEQGKRSRA